MEKIKANPFAIVIWVILSCVIHIILFKAKVDFDYKIWQRILITIIAIIFTLPTHELIHFVFMKMFFKGDVKIKIIKDSLGIPTLATLAQGEAKKRQRIIMYLAPLVFLTLLPDIIFGFCTKVHLLFYIVPICNSAGCFYDVVDALMVAKKNR
ncbi:MAG: DUF3267 domain-containing protein [Lachnospiraceae bacterium]|nr:DUF3267 domain-containing protein [Lachnospiraceae bacterium]